MAITLEEYFKSAKISVNDFREMALRHHDLVNALSLGVVDKALGMILREQGQAFINASRKRSFVFSPELESFLPPSATVPAERQIKLTLS
ncbi:hypothetical protein [Nonomuraea aurantiaca]|uniref:hypothetical protein n=1 Tax=Nonomuraea aurantiaca TaxID=2878562 RepID=UPI001CD99A2F|nr:hypothetical protein [Nonomuraea aurantiaca]MCA2227736.1 hypothetical protein [Nonomuraea aurantiaca]